MSMLPWAAMAVMSGAAGYFNPLAQPGDPGYREIPMHHLRLTYENDAAFGHDSNYTHGTRIDYAQYLGQWGGPREGAYWGLSLTQNIYTPETHARHAVPGEHPYAGYMELGGAILLRGRQIGSSTELQLGTCGEPSLAHHVQNGVHDLGGLQRWDGWKDQVPAEMTFQLSNRTDFNLPFVEKSWGDGWQSDGLVYTRTEVGTISIAGGVGMNFRFGKNLPDAMEVNGNLPASYGVGLLSKENYNRGEISYFLVAGFFTEYVARDLTIDGGVFHPFRNKTCSRRPWQVEGQLGVGLSYKGIDYFAGGVVHSRSYRTQDKNSAVGTFTITMHW